MAAFSAILLREPVKTNIVQIAQKLPKQAIILITQPKVNIQYQGVLWPPRY